MQHLRIALVATAAVLLLATHTSAASITIVVPGTADPWLAGMPDGSVASLTDTAPAQSPVEVPFAFSAGDILTFFASGAVSNGPCCPYQSPDGNPNIPRKIHNAGAENGISDVIVPHNSLLGVFLGAAAPNLTPAPGFLDFSVIGTDFSILSPELKQVFFIGDGLTSAGTAQQFVVPVNATRLFLGPMDGYEWMNNLGAYVVTVTDAGADDTALTSPPPQPTPEPATLLLLGGGLTTLAAMRRRR